MPKPKKIKEEIIDVPKLSVEVPEIPKNSITLKSYTIRATIPTGNFANIVPEITVEADSLESASSVVLPHIEMLYSKYLDYTVKPKIVTPPVSEMKVVSEYYGRALKMINGTKNKAVLADLKQKVKDSNNLLDTEKESLYMLIDSK